MSNAPVKIIEGIAAPLLRDNIDTDQIIPSREMKSVFKTGLADGLFAGQRYLEDRVPNPDFVLNQPEFQTASILLSGKNFGCGSSREHAVWALKEFGIKAIIAESFGDIFYKNCIRNGILPIRLAATQMADLPRIPVIDLPQQTVGTVSFDIDPGDKDMLVQGLNPITQTLQDKKAIDAFLLSDRTARPWIYAD